MSQKTRTENLRLTIDGEQVVNSYSEIQKASKKLTKELKGMEVGTTEYIKKSQQLNQVNARLEDVKQEIKTTGQQWKKTSDDFKKGIGDNIKGISVFGTSLGELESGFSNSSKGLMAVVKSTKLWKVALMSLGIPAIIAALASLYQYFTRNQQGINLINKVTSQLSATFDVLLDRLVLMGSGIAKFFSGDFQGASNDIKNSFKGIGDEMSREVKLAGELSDGFAEIEKREADLILTNAQRVEQIARLNKLAEDTSQSSEKRYEAARQALLLEQQRVDDAVTLQKDKVALLEKEYDRSESTIQDLAQLNTERASALDLMTQSLEKQTTIQNKLNQLAKELGLIEKELPGQKSLEIDVSSKTDFQDLEGVEVENNDDEIIDSFEQTEKEKLKIKEKYDELIKQAEDKKEQEILERLRRQQRAYGEFTGAISALQQLTGDKSQQLAKFQLMVDSAIIISNQAKAISAAISGAAAAASSGGPAAPLLLITHMSSMIAAVATGISQVKAMHEGLSIPAAPSFYFGGDTGSKGIGFGDRFGEFTGFTHKNEYVIPASMRNDPMVAATEQYIDSGRSSINVNPNITSSVNIEQMEHFEKAVNKFEMIMTKFQESGIPAYFNRNSFSDATEDLMNFRRESTRGRL